MEHPRDLFPYQNFWVSRCGVAPQLPLTCEDMEELGWDSCDIVLVTGNTHVNHPSFGMAFREFGHPNLFFEVTGGNMGSMVSRYTADHRIRSNDAYTPNGAPEDRRLDCCVFVS